MSICSRVDIKMVYQSVEPLASDMPLAVLVKASGSSPDGLSKRCVASEMLRLDESLESGDTCVSKIIVLQIRSGKFCTNFGAFECDLHILSSAMARGR